MNAELVEILDGIRSIKDNNSSIDEREDADVGLERFSDYVDSLKIIAYQKSVNGLIGDIMSMLILEIETHILENYSNLINSMVSFKNRVFANNRGEIVCELVFDGFVAWSSGYEKERQAFEDYIRLIVALLLDIPEKYIYVHIQ